MKEKIHQASRDERKKEERVSQENQTKLYCRNLIKAINI